MHRYVGIAAALAVLSSAALAQTPAREQLAKGQALWDQRLANSAIAAFEAAASDHRPPPKRMRRSAGMYTFKGWQRKTSSPAGTTSRRVRRRRLRN